MHAQPSLPLPLDDRAEANKGGAPLRDRARSSSHGNLVELDWPTGLWDAPHSGTSSGSEGSGAAATVRRGSAPPPPSRCASNLLQQFYWQPPDELTEAATAFAVSCMHSQSPMPHTWLLVATFQRPSVKHCDANECGKSLDSRLRTASNIQAEHLWRCTIWLCG